MFERLTEFQKILFAIIVAVIFYYALKYVKRRQEEDFGKYGRQSSYIDNTEDYEDVFDYYQTHNWHNIQSSTHLMP